MYYCTIVESIQFVWGDQIHSVKMTSVLYRGKSLENKSIQHNTNLLSYYQPAILDRCLNLSFFSLSIISSFRYVKILGILIILDIGTARTPDRWGFKDNFEIFFPISQQNHVLTPH